MGTERKRNLDSKIRSDQPVVDTRLPGPPIATNGHDPFPPGVFLPVRRLYSRRHAWAALLLWMILAAVLAPLAIDFASHIRSTLSGMKGTPSETVRINLVKNFSTALAFPTAIVWDSKGVPPDAANAAWGSLLDAIRGDAQVNDVTDGQRMVQDWPRPDWHAAFVAVNAKTYSDAQDAVPALRAAVAKLSFPGPNRPWVTGGPALFLDLNLASTESLRSGELIALPVAFAILLVVFRSLLAALIPVIVATLGVVITLGILCFLATPHSWLPWQHPLGITFFVPNLVTMIGLGVGIDYCLIYLARYRRERANHLTTQEALLLARRTAGRTVVASAILVMSGFLMLLLIPLDRDRRRARRGLRFPGHAHAAAGHDFPRRPWPRMGQQPACPAHAPKARAALLREVGPFRGRPLENMRRAGFADPGAVGHAVRRHQDRLGRGQKHSLRLGVAPRLPESVGKSRLGLDDAGYCPRAAYQRGLDDQRRP